MKKEKHQAARETSTSTAEEVSILTTKIDTLVARSEVLYRENCLLELIQTGKHSTGKATVEEAQVKTEQGANETDEAQNKRARVENTEEPPPSSTESRETIDASSNASSLTTAAVIKTLPSDPFRSLPAIEGLERSRSGGSDETPVDSVSGGATNGFKTHVEMGGIEVEVGEVAEVSALFDWGSSEAAIKLEAVPMEQIVDEELKRCTSCRNYLPPPRYA